MICKNRNEKGINIIVTLKDIAKVAGVSVATVSNALNDNGKTSTQLKERISRIADEMGYVPNSMATGLKKGKNHTLGIISEDITSFNMPDIIDGISKYADSAGYSLLLTNLQYSQKTYSKGEDYTGSLHKYAEQITELSNSLLKHNVDGIIYIGSSEWETKALINTTNKPVVYTYTYALDTSEHQFSVYYDDEDASYQAVKALIDLGHRRIGMITGPLHWIPVQKRWKGYQRALAEAGISLNPRFIRNGEWDMHDGERYGRDLLESQPITAIYGMNDEIAIGAMYAALEMGCKIPDDISIIGIDDSMYSSIVRPALSTMHLPLKEMGIESTKLLIKMIERNSDKLTDIKLRCHLVKRQSLGKCPE